MEIQGDRTGAENRTVLSVLRMAKLEDILVDSRLRKMSRIQPFSSP